jgi:hypothetical protein
MGGNRARHQIIHVNVYLPRRDSRLRQPLVAQLTSIITPELSTVNFLGSDVHDGEDTGSAIVSRDRVEILKLGAHFGSRGSGHIGSNHSRTN